MTPFVRRVLLVIAIVLFLVAGAGAGPFKFGTVELDLIGFGLACFAASFLA